MWQSYYEKKKVKFFSQLSKLLRQQFGASFFKSYTFAYKAAKAATTFQEGSNRAEYDLALPYLTGYFNEINKLSTHDFNVDKVAKDELEWWIIRRDPSYSYQDWEEKIMQVSAELYNETPSEFKEHAEKRVKAMRMRDDKGDGINTNDWRVIENMLIESWSSLHQKVN